MSGLNAQMLKKKTDMGFTLLEVMIAVSILAIALVGVLQLQSQSISMSSEARFKTTAALLAQGKMAEIESSQSLSSRTETGEFGPDFPQYNWRLEVADTQIPQFKRIEVTVFNQTFSRFVYKLVLYKTMVN